MLHDDQCELGKLSHWPNDCSCARRAYERDPLPDAPLHQRARTTPTGRVNTDWSKY